jgi:hypothetical protein
VITKVVEAVKPLLQIVCKPGPKLSEEGREVGLGKEIGGQGVSLMMK